GGSALTKNVQSGADVLELMASRAKHDADSAAKSSSYQRCTDELLLQYNLAARELMQIGRQILISLRRIKHVAVSIPSVAGPYTSVNCTLCLLKSSLRKSSIASDDYTRQGSEDDRFVD